MEPDLEYGPLANSHPLAQPVVQCSELIRLRWWREELRTRLANERLSNLVRDKLGLALSCIHVRGERCNPRDRYPDLLLAPERRRNHGRARPTRLPGSHHPLPACKLALIADGNQCHRREMAFGDLPLGGHDPFTADSRACLRCHQAPRTPAGAVHPDTLTRHRPVAWAPYAHAVTGEVLLG